MIDFVTISNNIPESPGVYIYKDKNKKVLYVGKAINLRNRVKSYFMNMDSLAPKTQALIQKIEKIETIKVENEIEALLLEADLIKRYHPPYNINLKDDKFYKYIVIEKPKIKAPDRSTQTVLKIGTTRKESNKKYEYFGPYPETNSILLITKTLRKIFPYRDCSFEKFNRYAKLQKPCLYGHIGLCPAPCQTKEGIIQNNENITKIKEYLTGKRSLLFKKLEAEMKRLSSLQEYEKASYLRDQIYKYNYLTQKKSDVKEYMKNPDLIDNKGVETVKKLILKLESTTTLKFSNSKPETFRIETYDISNIQGTNAVGAMSVTTGGISDKSEYKRFKIQTKQTPDDFEMLKEVLTRRFKRKENNEDNWTLPDLIVIDGGKGQLSSAIEALQINQIKIPIISIAKKEELLYFFHDGEFHSIRLNIADSGLKLIIAGRDEVHRFGINYHRKLRMKNLYS